MSKHPKTSDLPDPNAGIVVSDTPHAPYIYFDGSPNFGNAGGIVNLTLAAARHLSDNQQIKSDIVAVAYLRCSIQAAIDLRNAIDQALLIGAPVGSEMQN